MRNLKRILGIAGGIFMVQQGFGAAHAHKANHLVHEKSPYLLEHAYNPVDWYPWGEAAFRKARQEKKPIFLSIGYSTCHWCHVMERESFSDPKIAAILNKNFVSIKVDREERPDVDSLYMTAVQAMTGSGGWPLTVFLTPELKPFHGGTYFPPEARSGLPGFADLLERIADLWEHDRAKLTESGDQLAKAIAQYAASEKSGSIPNASVSDAFFQSYAGGFDAWLKDAAPKFPMPSNQNFLLRYYARAPHDAGAPYQQALDMDVRTLRAMARGGIYDQLGGGFHRYSTDSDWHVPHFEKMLYDNAQLAVNYIEAYQAVKDEDFARTARETLEYLERDMAHHGGGFYSAEDADSLASVPSAPEGKGNSGELEHKTEGAFYVWDASGIDNVLGGPAAIMFEYRYGVEPGGNAANDPQGEFKGKNILYAAHTIEETAKKFGKSEGETQDLLQEARKKLLAARSRRQRPHQDDKILASWNGLAITAFAKAGAVFNDAEFLSRAEKTASFLRSHLYDSKNHRLYHRWREGERRIPGMADDYAFLIQGLIDLYESSFNVRWLEWAIELTDEQNKLFYDSANGGFFMTSAADSKDLLVRAKTNSDGVEPAASSVAALNLLRLAQFTDRTDFRQAAEKTLAFFGNQMREHPRSLPQMLCALDFYLADLQQIVIAGNPAAPDTLEMLRAVNAKFLPNKILVLAEGRKGQKVLARYLPFIQGVHPTRGKATAYVCAHYSCDFPTSDLQVFRQLLDGQHPVKIR